MQDELKILINACKKNDRKAQGSIYNMFSKKMYSVCLRYSNSSDDAKDNLQDSFILAFEKITQFQHKGSFEGWLRRLTLNTCLKKLRTKTFYVVEDYQIVSDDDFEEKFDIIEKNKEIDYKEVMELLENMPTRYRTIFNLYLVEDYSHKEIAEELKINIGTSKSNLSRAKDWLRKELKKKYKMIKAV